MTNAVNMIEFIKKLQQRPRGRACIVFTQDYFKQKEWAIKLAQLTNSKHIDLLELFSEKSEYSDKLGTFSVNKLFKFLQNYDDCSVLIVTGIEFLKAIWMAQSRAIEQFASEIETWRNSPALLFVTQFDIKLAKSKFTRYPDNVYIVDQNNTLELT